MNNETVFYQKVNERRVQLGEVDKSGFNARAILYVNSAVTWAASLQINELPVEKLSIDDDPEEIQKALFNLEQFMDEIRARNIFIVEPNLLLGTVSLDENWKAYVSTLVGHIREAVRKAAMEEKLREPILQSLDNLQAQVDKNRTRIDALAQTWLEVTGAIGEGAKNLEPAVALLGKLRKVFGKAERLQIEAKEQPRLPPPEEIMDDE